MPHEQDPLLSDDNYADNGSDYLDNDTLDHDFLDDSLIEESMATTASSASKQFALPKYQAIEVYSNNETSALEDLEQTLSSLGNYKSQSTSLGLKVLDLLGKHFSSVTTIMDVVHRLPMPAGSEDSVRDPQINNLLLNLSLHSWSQDPASLTIGVQEFWEICKNGVADLNQKDPLATYIKERFLIRQVSATLPTANALLDNDTQTRERVQIAMRLIKLNLTLDELLETQVTPTENKTESTNEVQDQIKATQDEIEHITSSHSDIATIVSNYSGDHVTAEQALYSQLANTNDLDAVSLQTLQAGTKLLRCKLCLKPRHVKRLIGLHSDLIAAIHTISSKETSQDLSIKSPQALNLKPKTIALPYQNPSERYQSLLAVLSTLNKLQSLLTSGLVNIKEFSIVTADSQQEWVEALAKAQAPTLLNTLIESNFEDKQNLNKLLVEQLAIALPRMQDRKIDCSYTSFSNEAYQTTAHLFRLLVSDPSDLAQKTLQLLQISLGENHDNQRFIEEVHTQLSSKSTGKLAKLLTRRITELTKETRQKDQLESQQTDQDLALSIAIVLYTLEAITTQDEIVKNLRLQIPSIGNITDLANAISDYCPDPNYFTKKAAKIKRALDISLKDAPLKAEHLELINELITNYKFALKHPELRGDAAGDELFPSAILFLGEPGTGKTFTTDCIKNEIEAEQVFEISLLTVAKESLTLDNDQLNVFGAVLKVYKEIVEAAQEQPNKAFMLVLDEAEAFLVNRKTAGVSSEEVRLNNLMLQMLSDIRRKYPNVFIVACSNYKEMLDKAGIRDGRFDYEFTLEHPTEDIRKIVLERAIYNALTVSSFDVDLPKNTLDQLAKMTDKLPFVSLKQIVNQTIRLEWSMQREVEPEFTPSFDSLVQNFEKLIEYKQSIEELNQQAETPTAPA